MPAWLETDYVLQVLVSAFFAILFLQSGIDKVWPKRRVKMYLFGPRGFVVDRAANLEWLRGHFKATPLASFVPFLVLTLTILELVSGLFCAVGLGVLLAGGSSLISYLGSIMCGVTFLALFFGQRLAKDYAGAAALAPYFLVSLASIYITRVRMA